jgi:predicted AAA+ superfamily ATPase
MIDRTLALEAVDSAREYPVVTVVGPRQAGKTTLVRATFADHRYVNLEEPEAREVAELDPRSFFKRHPAPVILDEIQRVPSLLSTIQVDVDADPSVGRYVLTGSHQTSLHQAISQSLAGRTAILQLLPLSLEELAPQGSAVIDVDEILVSGFLPRIHAASQQPTRAYRSYFQTYVERDLRQLVEVKNLATFQRFLRLCAGRVGQLFNANALAAEVGVSNHTIEHWTSALESSYLVLRLQPYFENFNKRFVKAPKLYFTEVGLATYLLGLEKPEQVARDPLRGALFENMVMIELIKARLHRGREPGLYFVRDHKGTEIDGLLTRGRDLVPIEIKAAATFHRSMTGKLDLLRRWAGERVTESHVVYGGEASQQIGTHTLTSYRHAHTIGAV